MENSTLIYWLTRLDYINSLGVFVIAFCLVGLIVIYLFPLLAFDEYDEDERTEFISKTKSMKKLFIAGIIFFSLLITFLPKKDDMILIIAGGKTLDFIQQDSSVSKMPSQTMELISKMLDEKIKELNK